MQEVVRIDQPSDEDEIMQLFTLMHSEGGLMPLDEMEARSMLHRVFNRQGGILGVIGEPGHIKAMIYLLISKFWYTKHFHLEELFNFVRPDCRLDGESAKERYGTKLIQFAKKCSDEIGLPLTIGVLTNIRMEAKVRMYQRELGVPAGAWFVHFPNGTSWQNQLPNNEFWRDTFGNRATRKMRERHTMTAVGK